MAENMVAVRCFIAKKPFASDFPWRAQTIGRPLEQDYLGEGETPQEALNELRFTLERLLDTKVLLLLGTK